MKKVVKQKTTLYQSDAHRRCGQFREFLDKNFAFTEPTIRKIVQAGCDIFLAAGEDEITPDELTDDMTLVNVDRSKDKIRIEISASGDLNYRWVSLTHVPVLYFWGPIDRAQSLVEDFPVSEVYAFTNHIEALEFALEQLKKQEDEKGIQQP